MAKYGKGNFGKGMEINAQVVNGKCPFCEATSVLVSLHKTIFRCMHCGSDIEQKINGKISYIPVGGPIKMRGVRDLTDG
tara:strand:+ start:339 stop:575 length:237 start_codon:yes stop_codon:yes gene_type:complete